MRYCVSFFFLLLLSILFVTEGRSNTPLVRYDSSKGEYRRRDEARVYIVGKIVNIAEELQHRPGGADAQDALYSKGRQGLKTSGAQIWTFVDNIKGQELQWNKDYLGKYVKILGWVFHDAQYVEIDSFSFEGLEFSWNEKTAAFESQASTAGQESRSPEAANAGESAQVPAP